MEGIRSAQLPAMDLWKRLASQMPDLVFPHKTASHPDTCNPESLPMPSAEEAQTQATDSRHQKEAAEMRYDEDGIRVVFDSGPSETTKAHRAAWKAQSLNDKIRWTQTTEDVLVWITLPKGHSFYDLSHVSQRRRC